MTKDESEDRRIAARTKPEIGSRKAFLTFLFDCVGSLLILVVLGNHPSKYENLGLHITSSFMGSSNNITISIHVRAHFG